MTKYFFFDFPRAANATHSSVSYSSLSGHYSTTACVCARCSQSATGARYLSAALQRIAFALAQQIKKIVFCVASLTWGGTIVQRISCSAPFVPRSTRSLFFVLRPLTLGRVLFPCSPCPSAALCSPASSDSRLRSALLRHLSLRRPLTPGGLLFSCSHCPSAAFCSPAPIDSWLPLVTLLPLSLGRPLFPCVI